MVAAVTAASNYLERGELPLTSHLLLNLLWVS